MDSNVAAVAATMDMIAGGGSTVPQTRVQRAPRPVIDDMADLRLVIELDENSGKYIYKTIDRSTGEVIVQLPREQLLRMRNDADYHAGAVIKTSA
ncbi:MAG TPA: flagellar protein FlaG [Phenylobacterium sp.]